MRISRGRVVAGHVVVDGEPLAEGSTVAVIVSSDESAFEVTPAQKAELLEAVQQADRGELVEFSDLFAAR